MTDEQIYRELCKLDPSLEKHQKCEHKWRKDETTPRDDRASFYCGKCKCGLRMVAGTTPPVFGDGDATRYDSVDALLALCERLEVDSVDLGYTSRVDGTLACSVEIYLSEHDGGKGASGDTILAALTEAILSSKGAWVE